MKNLALGTFLAAVAMFLWGFVFFGSAVGSATFSSITLEQETALAAALRQNVPADGTYVLPAPFVGNEASFAERMAAGPSAMVHFARAGSPAMDPMLMLKGFVHMLVTALLLAMLLRRFGGGLSGYGERFRLALLIGVIVAVWANLANPIWWHQSWQHHGMIALYDLVGIGLAGAVLARFVRPHAT